MFVVFYMAYTKDSVSNAVVKADTQAALQYRDEIAKIAEVLGKKSDDIPLELIIAQDGVLSVSHEYNADQYWAKIEPVFQSVFSQFIADRAREGENLKKDLLAKLDTLDTCAAFS